MLTGGIGNEVHAQGGQHVTFVVGYSDALGDDPEKFQENHCIDFCSWK